MNGERKKSPVLEAITRVREAEARTKAIIREAQEKTAVQIITKASAEAEKAEIMLGLLPLSRKVDFSAL